MALAYPPCVLRPSRGKDMSSETRKKCLETEVSSHFASWRYRKLEKIFCRISETGDHALGNIFHLFKRKAFTG